MERSESRTGKTTLRYAALAMAGGGLFSACLVAVHSAQVIPGRMVRRYVLGIFWAGLSAYLLWQALYQPRYRELWWTAYGLSAAAFCYTHYYAFFTLLAQALFVLGEVVLRWRKRTTREALATAGGFLYAGVLALILYYPWLGVLERQSTAVRQDYWIPPVSAAGAQRVFFPWGTGVEYPGVLEKYVWLGLLTAGSLWALWQAPKAAWFFLLQAAMPWVLGLGISAWTGRTIFLDRYLAFANWALLGLWGVIWSCLPGGWLTRLALGVFVGGLCVQGLSDQMRTWPDQPPPITQAAAFLRERYEPGDVVVLGGPTSLNVLRYYATQAGLREADMRCPVNVFGPNHYSHAAALTSSEILWSGESEAKLGKRLWRASESGSVGLEPPEGMVLTLSRTFESGGKAYALALFERRAGRKER